MIDNKPRLETLIRDEHEKSGGELSRDRIAEIITKYDPNIGYTHALDAVDKNYDTLIPHIVNGDGRRSRVREYLSWGNAASDAAFLGGLTHVWVAGKVLTAIPSFLYDTAAALYYGATTRRLGSTAGRFLQGASTLIPWAGGPADAALGNRMSYSSMAARDLLHDAREGTKIDYVSGKHSSRIRGSPFGVPA